MKIFIKYILLVVLTSAVAVGYSQDRFTLIERDLNQLSITQPGLNGKVELSVSGVSIQEFIRGISAAHNLNVSVSPEIKGGVVNNFADARVADVFLYLCREYELDIHLVGSIIAFNPYRIPPPEPEPVAIKQPKVNYSDQTDFLSLDLKRDTIDRVAEAITKITLKNVILAPEVRGKAVSVYIQNRPFDNAMEKMAYANGLKFSKTEDNFYVLELLEEESEVVTNAGRNSRNTRSGNRANNTSTEGILSVKSSDDGRLTVNAENVPIADIIAAVSAEKFKNYFLFSVPEGNSSLYVENATYDEFLRFLLNGSDFTFKVQDKVYLIGQRNIEGLRTTELVRLQNRTVETIIEFIPAELKKDVDIKEFIELNGLILSGSHPKIEEIKTFVREIDQVVPVVMIEVLIVDVSKNHSINAGVRAGIGSDNTVQQTSGTLSPGVQIDFSSESVNRLIGTFNGFGLVNLGNVTPDFYLSIQALESNGVLKTRSTPKLSTLNGHEANLRIGKTEYYLEVNNNVIGTQNPQNIISQTYRSTNADLSVTIKPIVSGDEQVTLEITVEQSDFTGRISENAPPGTVSRNFKSTVRVRNNDMILLGGLEERSANSSGTGLPFISRIPVLKWFTGTRTREQSKSKLNIFIKPTILY